MKTFIVIICLILTTSIGFAQSDTLKSIDELLIESSMPKCHQYKVGAGKILPDLFRRGEIDSIYSVLGFIENNCEDVTEVVHTKVLLAGYNNNWQEEFGEQFCIDHITNYIKGSYGGFSVTYICRDDGETIISNYGQHDFGELYYQIIQYLDKRSIVYLYGLTLVGNDSTFFETIQSPPFTETDIYQVYIDEVVQSRNKISQNVGFYSASIGSWHPKGNLEILGGKLDMGATAGYKFKKDQVSGMIFIRVLNGKNVINLYEDGQSYYSNKILGALFGIEYGHTFAELNKYRPLFTIGLGYELIEIINPDFDEAVNIGSFNLNFGIQNKLFVDEFDTKFLSLDLKYHMTDFSNEPGTNLSGNSFSVGLTFGWNILKKWQYREYKRLRYHGDK